MRTTIVNSKWQITIPVNVRRTLQLGLGDRIEFVEIDQARCRQSKAFLLIASSFISIGIFILLVCRTIIAPEAGFA
jgi:bifunctional DNA-binding transcriptional regulator/antitoxin component of YhaV-PrlF toxin-antitoxin module